MTRDKLNQNAGRCLSLRGSGAVAAQAAIFGKNKMLITENQNLCSDYLF